MSPFVSFQTTLWSNILKVQQDDPEALDRFARRYRSAIVGYLLQKGHSSADAEDLTQEVFARILEKRLLQRADRSRGRLRSLLLGVTENVVREWRRNREALKRGGDATTLSLDQTPGGDQGPTLAERIPENRQDSDFDRQWVRNLLANALERVRKELPHYVEVLEVFLLGTTDCAEIAAKLNRNVKDVYNLLQRARAKLVMAFQSEIGEYASSEGEYKDEVAYLLRFIAT